MSGSIWWDILPKAEVHCLYSYTGKVLVWGKTKSRLIEVFIGYSADPCDIIMTSGRGYALACSKAEEIARKTYHMKVQESQCVQMKVCHANL